MWTLVLLLNVAWVAAVALPKTYATYESCMKAGEAAMSKNWHYSKSLYRDDVEAEQAFRRYVCTGVTDNLKD